jgi:phage-related protein
MATIEELLNALQNPEGIENTLENWSKVGNKDLEPSEIEEFLSEHGDDYADAL